MVFVKIWGAPSFPGTFSSRGRAQPLRGNGCSWTGQGEAWELVGLNTPLHCLGDEAKVIQLVSRSKGTAPAGDPGFGCDDRHLHPPEEKALELGCPAGPASGRFVCCRENRDSQGSWPVSAQGFPAGEGRTSAQQLSVNAIQWKNQDGWRCILPQPKRNPECCDLDTIFHTSEAEPRASVPAATGFGSSFCSFSLFLDHHLRCILSSDPLRVLS